MAERITLTVLLGTFIIAGLIWALDRPTDAERIERLTYEEARPYLEARYTIREDWLWLCDPDNFAKLRRDPLLERVSRQTALLYHESARHNPRVADLSPYGPGDSPWGAFADPDVKRVLLPAFEEAKRRIVASLKSSGSSEQAAAVARADVN